MIAPQSIELVLFLLELRNSLFVISDIDSSRPPPSTKLNLKNVTDNFGGEVAIRHAGQNPKRDSGVGGLPGEIAFTLLPYMYTFLISFRCITTTNPKCPFASRANSASPAPGYLSRFPPDSSPAVVGRSFP